jgi:succinate dehydrogenase / fumarate reductase, membrane anchor subunit
MTRTNPQPQGVWPWIGQRLTGILLVLLLGTHLAVLHYVPANMNINVLSVAMRVKNVLYMLVDSGLLVLGLFHGLNGIRNVLFDFIIADGPRRWLNRTLFVVGAGFTLWGAYALWVFIQ